MHSTDLKNTAQRDINQSHIRRNSQGEMRNIRPN